MKHKFIIARASANAYWNYYNKNHRDKILPEYKSNPPIVNEVVDCFLNGCIKEATKFDSYEDAQKEIESFSKIEHEKKEGDEIIKTYPGVGIYKIDKIFVIDLP